MYPKTFYGWYNKLIRGHPYNEKTAYILDFTFKPSTRLLSTLEDKKRSINLTRKPDLRNEYVAKDFFSRLEKDYFWD